jgi:hypothetical protein
MKPIVLNEKAWALIYNKMAKEYPPSFLLIREKMKSMLGFTVRRHEEWIDSHVDINDVSYGTKWRINTIHLDFYNNPKRTMFLLKYSEFLDKSINNLDIE